MPKPAGRPAVDPLSKPVSTLRGVGPSLARKLTERGLSTVQDLWLHLPRGYEDRTALTAIRDLLEERSAEMNLAASLVIDSAGQAVVGQLAQRLKLLRLRVAAEQLYIFAHRLFKLVVIGQRRAAGQAELTHGPLLGRTPFEAFLHHQAGRCLSNFSSHVIQTHSAISSRPPQQARRVMHAL